LDTFFVSQLAALKPNQQSAEWIEALLEDPRLDSVENARHAAVSRLLAFGHPWALRISPEELARHRRHAPPRRKFGPDHTAMAIGGLAAGIVALMLFPRSWAAPSAPLTAAAGLWAGSVVLRAVLCWDGLARAVLKVDLTLAAIAFVAMCVNDGFVSSLNLIAVAVPIAIAAFIGKAVDPYA
jgi:hypothetical protein